MHREHAYGGAGRGEDPCVRCVPRGWRPSSVFIEPNPLGRRPELTARGRDIGRHGERPALFSGADAYVAPRLSHRRPSGEGGSRTPSCRSLLGHSQLARSRKSPTWYLVNQALETAMQVFGTRHAWTSRCSIRSSKRRRRSARRTTSDAMVTSPRSNVRWLAGFRKAP